MTTYLNAVLIGVAMLALAVACSCQRSRSGPSSATADAVPPDAAVLDIASDDDETSGAEDSLSEQDTLEEVVDQDTADIVGGVETLEDAKTSPACSAVALPAPGEPCSQEDAVRCSNLNAVFNGLATFAGIGCYRPNVVTCKASEDGLRWTLATCESITGFKSGVPPGAGICANSVSCVVRSVSDHGCQPVSISYPMPLEKTSPSKQSTTLSQGHAFGGQWCSPTASNPQLHPDAPPWCNGKTVVQCMPIDKTPFKDQVLAAAGDCAKYLLKGEWTFPIELCQVDPISCAPKSKFCVLPEYQSKPECKEYFHIGCNNEKTSQDPFYDPITNKLRCKKDCFEAGAPGYAPGE
jgi:hypothetical protein